jgi:hypothetical protein
VRRFWQEKIEEWRWNLRTRPWNARGVLCVRDRHEFSAGAHDENETEAMILHELGGAGRRAGTAKNARYVLRSKAEIMVRAVRDILADCLSTLPSLLATNNTASLHFYFANFTGMRKHLYPEALEAYRRWATAGDRQALSVMVESGQRRWLETAHAIMNLYREREQAANIKNLLERGRIAHARSCLDP